MMKLLNAEELHAGLKRNIDMLNRLEGEMQRIENVVNEFTQMGESLKGQGGEALRNFYSECHLPFLQFFMRFKESFSDITEQIDLALTSLEPDQSGVIQQAYLEADIVRGLNQARDVIVALTTETNAIMNTVSDIVSLPRLDESETIVEIENANIHRDQTVNNLLEFDYTQTNALTKVEKDLKIMSTWIGNIQHFMVAGLSDVHFSTPHWKLLSFMSIVNPTFTSHMKLQEILKMSISKNPQTSLQTFRNGMDQDISKVEENKDTEDELEAFYKAIANGEAVSTTNFEAIEYMKEHNLLANETPIGPNGEYLFTFEGMKKVVGGNGTGTLDGLAPFVVTVGQIFVEDFFTLASPEATVGEKFQAGVNIVFKPAKAFDKVSDVLNVAEKTEDVTKNGKKITKGTGKTLLPGEGKVGTYEELIDAGTRGDNITPHHMPSKKYMETNAGVHKDDGVSMNMEHPHPGKGGRHRETETYGLIGEKLQEYLNLDPRDALARDIWDARRIYQKDGLYTPEISSSLQEVIELNKTMYPQYFDKK